MAIPGLFLFIFVFSTILTKKSILSNWESRVNQLTSVTRLGYLLDFGPLFKAFGNN